MYTAYLVDDEPMVLNYMRLSVEWAENNFLVAGQSSDPLTALDEILLLKPNVVFTDIQMPRMDGLELIQSLKEKGCQAEFVVVSAYDKYTYVRQLILLEGFDYLIKPVEKEQMAELFTRLCGKLMKTQDSPKKPVTASPELNRILEYLSLHFMDKQSLNQIAERFAINPNYICRLFAKYVETTFSTYLQKLRMTHASFLLRTTDHSIKEISAQSGYDDYFYFCRVFKETYGVTPTQFRSGQ